MGKYRLRWHIIFVTRLYNLTEQLKLFSDSVNVSWEYSGREHDTI